MKKYLFLIILGMLIMLDTTVFASSEILDLLRLQRAYPEFIAGFSGNTIIWSDGTEMPIHEGKTNKSMQEKLDSPALIDQVKDVHYEAGLPINIASFNPQTDPGRIRYQPFFKKMYGDTEKAVRKNLVLIQWMPSVFGNRYPLLVTHLNGVADKIRNISQELESLLILHPEFKPYVDHPETFIWRPIAETTRLSPHSFGMTIDINPSISNYWQWDLEKAGKPVTEQTPLTYRNSVPWEIVLIFEKYGFIWGGKWHHYDSMHFEYRPEIF